jgi:hypothetical protein
MRRFSKRIAWFCLLLTFLSAFVFVAHHHSKASEAAKCAVCVAAHSASPKAIIIPRGVMFVSVTTLLPEPISAKQRLIVFALSVRPPPSV